MKKIIIIRGNSGSGKTSVAKLIQQKLGNNTLLLSQDTIRREMLNARDGAESPAKELMFKLLEYGYENSDVVIMEGILNSTWYKELFDRIVELYGKNAMGYYYDISFEETLRRHKKRPKSQEFGETEMRRWWNEKDHLEQIEEKMIREEYSITDVVDLILADLQ